MYTLRNKSRSFSNSATSSETDDTGADSKEKPAINLIKAANSKIKLLPILTNTYGLKIERANNYDEWSIPIKCPIHKSGTERTPSFGYNFSRDYFNCFGCSVSGGVVDFISAKEKLSKYIVAEQLLRDFDSYEVNDTIDEIDPDIDPILFDFAKFIEEQYRNHINLHEQIDKIVWWFDLFLVTKAPRKRITVEELQARIEKATTLILNLHE